MNTVEPAAITDIDMLAEERFHLEVQREDLIKTFKTEEAELKKRFAQDIAPVEDRISQLDAELIHRINDNRDRLIARGKQSFVTLVARFQFKKSTITDKVQDTSGVMEVARRLGVVRQIADPIRGYKLNRRKFGAWLKAHPEHREAFDEYLELQSGESLTMQPNSTYTVKHDSQRVSPPSISIKNTHEVD